MKFVTIGDRRYTRFDRLAGESGLSHLFTTRPHSISANGRPDDVANREIVSGALGSSPDRLNYCRQVHEPGIVHVNAEQPGGVLRATDGVFTNDPNRGLMTFSADCPLVLAYDPGRRAVGIVHASWRCTVAHATRRLIGQMCDELGCWPANMLAGIGPSAGPCCYEVKGDVYEAAGSLADRNRFFHRDGDRMTFDLWSANRAQLVAAGIPESSVEIAGQCTICDNGQIFYSYRREGPGCGHFALAAMLRSE